MGKEIRFDCNGFCFDVLTNEGKKNFPYFRNLRRKILKLPRLCIIHKIIRVLVLIFKKYFSLQIC
jgi:hypothetical protein